MSTAAEFVDTNVLLYAVSTVPAERKKAERARSLLDRDDLSLSVQVLQEFYVQATRATKPARLSHEQASQLIESFLRFPVQEMTVGVMQAALATARRFKISYWDAAIVEAARAIGCSVILSEDLSDGQDYGGVRVRNPFLC
ncbi:MAG: PIN domain-containing protein [Candidatus Wallbacteria bacterium]|nr:PIN domain-containing protein [Candidatus Wallbacteria bacterium]